jgi:hypothetical protein
MDAPTQGGADSAPCWIARRASEFWDFIDRRDIDKHTTSLAILLAMFEGTLRLTKWGTALVDQWMTAATNGHPVPGTEVAMVVGAVLAPWSLLVSVVVTAVVGFYFKARNQ